MNPVGPRPARRVCLLLALGLALAATAEARVTRITITRTESPTYSGQSFGTVGQYEKIIGTATGELDPADRHNAIIQDIQLAPRNAGGEVEYTASFTLVKPIDASTGNGVLFYNVVNRGNRNFPYTGVDPGDGFLQKRGYTLLWSGWQGDVVPAANNANEWVQVPSATNPDGTPVTGPVIYRVSNIPAGTNTIAFTAVPPGGFSAFPYRPATLDTTQARAETHSAESETAVTGTVTPIASGDWAFADCRTVPFPGTPDPSRICLRSGFDPSLLYQFTFTAKDPLVLGVGLAAMRDVMSFFRFAAADAAGTANPVAGGLAHVLAEGTSQSGNLLKTFIHLGFNEDEQGRQVVEGANAHIAARQTPINFRFALPGGAGTLYEPGSEPVLWWEDYTDATRARTRAGMLDRCRATATCPKIIETFGATEFWDLRMSPGLAGTDGGTDIPLPDNVRRYYFPGTSHGGGAGGFSVTTGAAGGAGGACRYMANPNPEIDSHRALFIGLNDWVIFGTTPPASRYPTLAAGTLVESTKAATGFPTLPNLPFIDHFENTMLDYDFGPAFVFNDMSGVISSEPPGIKQKIPTLVVKVNADGNEVAGIPSLLHQLPLGTYLGWNVVTTGFNKDRICAFTGGFVPFARTKAERMANGDPRPSLEERYPSFSSYYFAAAAAIDNLVTQRYLLPEDGQRIFQQALAQMLANGLVKYDALAKQLLGHGGTPPPAAIDAPAARGEAQPTRAY